MEPTNTRAPETVDLLLAGGIVVTMDPRHTVFNPGAVAVRGNAIVAVGPRDQVSARYRAGR
jgi:5-methylthioadenosine/S-adenosylhomocysteine deaminase